MAGKLAEYSMEHGGSVCRHYRTHIGGYLVGTRAVMSLSRIRMVLVLLALCCVRSGSAIDLSNPELRDLVLNQLSDGVQKRSVGNFVERSAADTNADPKCNVTFRPDDISIAEDKVIPVNYSIICSLYPNSVIQYTTDFQGIKLLVRIPDDHIAVVEGQSEFDYTLRDESGQEGTESSVSTSSDLIPTTSYVLPADVRFVGHFSIRGLQFGRTHIEATLTTVAGTNVSMSNISHHNIVVRKQNATIDLVYLIIIGVMIVIYNFGFGCKVESKLILEIVKKPVAPAIGFCCQFLIMSPLSFGVARLLHLPDEAGLGLLAIGSAPGGGGSNVFAYLLNGDLELSITMTFVSTVASLGMTPLWIWALGRFFTGGNTKIKIPVQNVFSSLAIVTIPVIFGILVNKYKPRAAKKIAWCLKPATAIIGIVFISLGVYVYYSALKRVIWQTLVACIVVSFCGYTIGAAIGKICRQTRARWITIALETGFQNLALALMIIASSLDPPESDLAGVVPVCYTFLSSSLPTLVFIVKFIHRVRKGDKPWAKSESLDVNSGDKGSVVNSPADKYHMGDVAHDTTGVTCTVSTISHSQSASYKQEMKQDDMCGATEDYGKQNGFHDKPSPTSENSLVEHL